MKKRICSLFLVFALMMTLLPTTVFASASTSRTCGNSAMWSFDSVTGTLTISGSGRMYDYDHEYFSPVDDEYDKAVPWASIADQIKKVSIGNKITYIGKEAFSGGPYSNIPQYPNLETITFEDKSGVTEMGDYAFRGATAVKSMVLPASLERVGDESFPVKALKAIYVENGNRTFYTDDGVLYQGKTLLAYPTCRENSNYAVRAGTKEISPSAVANSFLTSVSIPGSVEKIPYDAFFMGDRLSQITFEEGIKEIDNSNFWYCPALTRIDIPASVTAFTTELGCPDALLGVVDTPLAVYFLGSAAPAFDAGLCQSRSTAGKVTVYYPNGATGWDAVQAQEDVKAAVAEGILEFKISGGSDVGHNTLRLVASTPANGAALSDDELVLTFSSDISLNPYWLNGSIYIKDYYTDATIITIDDRGFYSHNGYISENKLIVPLAFTKLPIGQYYIEIDTNVIAAANADESGVISFFKGTQKGELVFYQKSAYVTMKVDDGVNSNVNISWDDQWFDNPSSTYMHDLAIASMALSGAAYVENAYQEPQSESIQKALYMLGFEKSSIKSYNYYDYSLSENDNDVVSYAFARKKVHINTGTYDLIAVVVKGTSGNEEWYSNFNIGTDNTHRGFTLAKDGLMSSLRDYISGLGIQGTSTKILVTGHSRGAAVANLVAAELCDASYAAKANVYSYTFATPAVTTDSRRSEGHYNNIFNIVSGEDFVTQVPLKKWNYGRYGIDLLLPSRSYYGSGYTRVFNKMSSEYFALVGKEFEAYPNGTQAVRNVCDNVHKLAPTVVEFYRRIHSPSITTYEYFYGIAKFLVDGYSQIVSVLGTSVGDYTPIAYFFVVNHSLNGRIFAAHGMASYYSWLTTCTPEELFGTMNHGSAKRFKALTVACPVDVYVYDEAGNLVASVINETVAENKLAVSVEDGVKMIDLPNDQNYSVKVTATDSGKMDYTVQEYIATASGDDLQRTVEFRDLQLTDGQVFSSKIDNISDTAKETYALTTGNEVIYPDYDSNNTQQPSHSGSSGGGNSSSNSSSSSPSYSVSVLGEPENGTVTVSPRSAEKGDTVTITVKPNSGYQLDDLTAADKDGSKLKLTDKGSGKYTFTMPASKVEIRVTFVKEVEASPFADVATNAYYYEAVKWAVSKGITDGIGDGTFNPNGSCTRAHIVTFLWRAAGSPEPKNMVSFVDVPVGSYYAKAVAWAVENGITLGTGNGTFNPNTICTRAQSMTFLFRASGATANGTPVFSDVSTGSYYAEAVKWATDNGITDGIGSGLFGSNNDCTRAQIVTFLWRFYMGK